MSLVTIVLIALCVCAVLFMAREELATQRALRGPRKKFWVNLNPEDPLMVEAVSRARATLPTFEELRLRYPQFASLSIGPISAEGDMTPVLVQSRTEAGYIVRRAKNDDAGGALAVGDAFAVTAGDIVDWLVYESAKKDRIHGGYTIRAVAKIAARDGLKMPITALWKLKKFVED